jgi:hypothetical protein
MHAVQQLAEKKHTITSIAVTNQYWSPHLIPDLMGQALSWGSSTSEAVVTTFQLPVDHNMPGGRERISLSSNQ